MTEGSIADYLRTMADLTERGLPLRNGSIARALEVTPASVTGMVRRMREKRLVAGQTGAAMRLTEKGRMLACNSVRRHRLIETWLIESLGMAWADAHEEAHRLEHALSPRLEAAIDAHLGHPERDPHGALIPDANGRMNDDDLLPLSELPDDTVGIVSRLGDRDAEKLRYWSSLGIGLGARVKLLASAPYGGPVEISVNQETVYLGPQALDGIWVRLEEKEK